VVTLWTYSMRRTNLRPLAAKRVVIAVNQAHSIPAQGGTDRSPAICDAAPGSLQGTIAI
jgi:hypothetical protein